MTELIRVKARWSGFTGGPGYTVLHMRDFGSGDGGGGPVNAAAAQGAATRARTFFAALATLLPAEVRINIDPEVDVLEDTTGELIRSFTVNAGTFVAGTANANYSTALGGIVNWRTDGIRNGRRVRGRSFLVPLSSNAFTTGGQLSTASQTLIQNAATALADITGSPDLMVYARPTSKGATDGRSFVVTSAYVPQLGAVLRSRRD